MIRMLVMEIPVVRGVVVVLVTRRMTAVLVVIFGAVMIVRKSRCEEGFFLEVQAAGKLPKFFGLKTLHEICIDRGCLGKVNAEIGDKRFPIRG